VSTEQKVTLCCVDTVHHALAAAALRRSSQLMRFAKVVFLTDKPEFADSGWECHRIRLSGYEEFNRFMLKSLAFHIETDFVLVVQFDGFVINPGAWTDEFLNYDYIGAPMPHVRPPYSMGNGGFSLRSRKLLAALQDDRIVLPPNSINEDICICASYRSYLEFNHGISFAPLELASRFSYESGAPAPTTFGFHNLSWLAAFYTAKEALFMIDSFQPYLMKNFQMIALALQYAYRNLDEESARLFRRLAQHQTYEELRERLIKHNAKPDMVAIFDRCWQQYVIESRVPA
jgi:Protein of unknown function (DUF5672)